MGVVGPWGTAVAAASICALMPVVARPAPAVPEITDDGDGLFVWSGSIGLGAALRAARRAEHPPPTTSEAYSGLGQLYGRLAAYDHSGVAPGLVKFIAVDISQTLDLGATISRDMSASSSETRRRLAFGGNGTLAMQLGWAGDGATSWYVKSLLEQRFAAHLNGRVEGAHYVGASGAGGGLRVHRPGRWVLHVGPIVAGSAGLHDLGRLVRFSNLLVGGDLGLFVRPARGVQLAWTIRGDHGFFDRRAGVRDHWRATLDLALARAGPGKIRSINVVVVYEGDRVTLDAAPATGQTSRIQETRVTHALMFGVGIGFGQSD